MEPIAHSANTAGQTHGLKDHLNAVASLASEFAAKWGAGDLGYWAGLWHDIGKLHPEFQGYLNDPGGRHRGPDHKSAGVLLAMKHMEPLAPILHGHHGGLMSRADLKAWVQEKAAMPQPNQVLRQIPEFFPALVPAQPPSIPSFIKTVNRPGERPGTEAEFLIRMVYSALVDADRLDTAAHHVGGQPDRIPPTVTMQILLDRFNKDQSRLVTGKTTPVNQVRQEVYAACCQAADLLPGLFRLTVPTGGGKTRSAMAFALRHAIANGLDRVIVGIPYTSIIEQTAGVYRAIFGPDAVLEHHSAVADQPDADLPTEQHQWMRLAAENWDMPIVVTTTVQLFESLLANRSSRCRKLHNIARSVLILDEVQTLPLDLSTPIVDVLRQLTLHYGCTIVLCSATQPALTRGPFAALPEVREIIADPADLFRRLQRVEYRLPLPEEAWTWERVAETMRQESRVLTILNTKRDAMDLISALADPTVLHLSTQMCGAHRRAVLEEIKSRLASGQVCRVVSTQVVEAGVDLDFPVVLRALGPLDRIVQAAGRCNREGRLDSGVCIVFRPAAGHVPPGSYRSGTMESEQVLRVPGVDLHDPAIFDRYFGRLYQTITPDAHGVMPLRLALDYPGTARAFKMIPDDTTAVIVRYPPEAGRVEQLVASLQAAQTRTGTQLLRQLQPYLVSVPTRLVDSYARDGLVEEVAPGLWRWGGGYDMQRGLVDRSLDPADLIL